MLRNESGQCRGALRFVTLKKHKSAVPREGHTGWGNGGGARDRHSGTGRWGGSGGVRAGGRERAWTTPEQPPEPLSRPNARQPVTSRPHWPLSPHPLCHGILLAKNGLDVNLSWGGGWL